MFTLMVLLFFLFLYFLSFFLTSPFLFLLFLCFFLFSSFLFFLCMLPNIFSLSVFFLWFLLPRLPFRYLISLPRFPSLSLILFLVSLSFYDILFPVPCPSMIFSPPSPVPFFRLPRFPLLPAFSSSSPFPSLNICSSHFTSLSLIILIVFLVFLSFHWFSVFSGFLFAQLYSFAETPHPPPPRIWAHIRGGYWSAKIDDISL